MSDRERVATAQSDSTPRLSTASTSAPSASGGGHTSERAPDAGADQANTSMDVRYTVDVGPGMAGLVITDSGGSYTVEAIGINARDKDSEPRCWLVPWSISNTKLNHRVPGAILWSFDDPNTKLQKAPIGMQLGDVVKTIIPAEVSGDCGATVFNLQVGLADGGQFWFDLKRPQR